MIRCLLEPHCHYSSLLNLLRLVAYTASPTLYWNPALLGNNWLYYSHFYWQAAEILLPPQRPGTSGPTLIGSDSHEMLIFSCFEIGTRPHPGPEGLSRPCVTPVSTSFAIQILSCPPGGYSRDPDNLCISLTCIDGTSFYSLTMPMFVE